MNQFELEREISRLTMGMIARNSYIVSDLIANLRTQLTLEEVAGIVLLSLERLTWLDSKLLFYCAENLVPLDIMCEIKRIISLNTYKQLIAKGLVPGKDFSIDADGKLLQRHCRRAH